VWTEYNPSGITYTAALIFQSQPSYGSYRRRRQYVQSIEFAAGGDPYVHTKDIPARNIREFSWRDMINNDWESLSDFIDILRGACFTFSFVDETGVSNEALIINPDDIRSAPVTKGFTGEISLEVLLI
jgi:hypothetical protein